VVAEAAQRRRWPNVGDINEHALPERTPQRPDRLAGTPRGPRWNCPGSCLGLKRQIASRDQRYRLFSARLGVHPASIAPEKSSDPHRVEDGCSAGAASTPRGL
jgi:hypothetical protein